MLCTRIMKVPRIFIDMLMLFSLYFLVLFLSLQSKFYSAPQMIFSVSKLSLLLTVHMIAIWQVINIYLGCWRSFHSSFSIVLQWRSNWLYCYDQLLKFLLFLGRVFEMLSLSSFICVLVFIWLICDFTHFSYRINSTLTKSK